jgi:hypothetical protein
MPDEEFEQRWEPYEPSSESQQVLQLVSEEGMITEAHLVLLLGWGKANAHHNDHRKPLDIEWLCITCHRVAGAALKEDDRGLTRSG